MDFLGLVGNFHSRPPNLIVVELKQAEIIADIEVDDFLVLEAFSNGFCNVVDSLIHLNTDFRFDSHLAMLIATPAIKLPIVHQSHTIGLARFDF